MPGHAVDHYATNHGPIIDAQVHTWLPKNDQWYPWAADHPTGYFETKVDPHPIDRVLSHMDEVGVDIAIAVVPRLYGWSNDYALDAARRFPARIALVARINWLEPDPLSRLQALRSKPGVVAIRLSRLPRDAWGPSGQLSGMLAAAELLDVPVCVMPGPPNLDVLDDVAKRHPGLRLVIDHQGMEAPPSTVPVSGPMPFEHLPKLLALASHPNVFVKLTAAPALSNEPFPFRDIWPAVHEIVGVFGAERVMWGSDYNRVAPLLSYREGLTYLREIGFDDHTLEFLYSRTAATVFDLAIANASSRMETT